MGIMDFIGQLFTEHRITKSISIIVAIILWTVVLGSQNVEVIKDIPVEVSMGSDLMVANEIPDRVSFRLSGPKAFLRKVLDRHDDPIRVNLTGSNVGNVTYRFFSDNIRVPLGVKVLSVQPPAIQIKLEEVKRKEVPVIAEYRGLPANGFRLTEFNVKPLRVILKGPESRISSVTEVHASPIDLSGIKDSFERELTLDLSRLNLQLDGVIPKVFVQIDEVASQFRIKDVEIIVHSALKSSADPKAVTVVARALSNIQKTMDRKSVVAVVDVIGKKPGRYRETPRVSLPNGVEFIKLIPDKVSVKVRE